MNWNVFLFCFRWIVKTRERMLCEENVMSTLRLTRDALLLTYDEGYISENEFCLLYNLNKSKDDYHYWNYEVFKLEGMDDSESWAQFRFYKRDIYRLKEVLRIPNILKTYNRINVDGVEALCILLKRFSYPCRYVDMIPHFGRAVPDYPIISNEMMEHLYNTFSHLLTDLNLPFSSRNRMEYCNAIYY